jgi:hypothetical protein
VTALLPGRVQADVGGIENSIHPERQMHRATILGRFAVIETKKVYARLSMTIRMSRELAGQLGGTAFRYSLFESWARKFI